MSSYTTNSVVITNSSESVTIANAILTVTYPPASYAADARTLDPSGSSGADYWGAPNPNVYGTARATTANIGTLYLR